MKGGVSVVNYLAILYTNKIIAGAITYADVPKGLKTAVADELRAAGCEDLITG